MRRCVLAVLVIALGLTTRAGTQGPPDPPRPAATMKQVMQGIVFPNANVIFAAQGSDPAAMPRDARPSLSTNPLAGLFGGWVAVENSGLALSEAADLLTVRGRTCANGTPVPVLDAGWTMAVQAMRDSGIAVAAAARARDQDGIVALTGQLTESCSGCHRTYRTAQTPCASPPRP